MPTGASSYAHTGTPTMVVSDARGLLLRTVQFHRREAADPVDTRVTEQRFDAAGRLAGSRDPYLFDLAHTDASTPFNLSQVTSLSGGALMTDSVDAGWRVVLPGDAGQPLEHWDGRGSHSLTEYDELLRPVAVRESGREVAEHTLERFTYADASAESAARNLCGQLIRHDDPAGTVHIGNLSITGNVLSHTRKFLTGTDEPDWPADVAGRDALLEPGDGATTAYTFAPGSELLSQTDAFGNVLAYAYTVDGVLKNTKLTLAGAGQLEKLLVSAIHYNASGQIESETAGNGVITRHRYDEANDRLTELSAHKADGTPLQDLKYHYDAAGNVLSIEDAAQPIRYFANQRIAPLKTYRYDTLDQLIEATGCEAKTGSGGPALPDFQALPLDPSQIANYTQTFYYDAGGNLLDLVHVGAQAHGRTLTRARYSNRCLPERDNRPPTEEELANGFDTNGNLRELQVGQSLTWDLRNQLCEVRPVMRKDKEDDSECYIYDGGGQRVRKVRSSLTNARAVLREVRYLPGVEVRRNSGSGEILHVISANAGSNGVQVLHWVSAPPDQMTQDQVRYGLNDHLKSSALELDQNADLISQEWYYPFGGTACWAGRNATEAKYKTVRYSGKERDATGLYYYGFRYYAPWLQHWINPDPVWAIDGLNFYRMLSNNPIAYIDVLGNKGEKFNNDDLVAFKNELFKESKFVFDSINNNEQIQKILEKINKTDSIVKSKHYTKFKTRILKLLAEINTEKNKIGPDAFKMADKLFRSSLTFKPTTDGDYKPWKAPVYNFWENNRSSASHSSRASRPSSAQGTHPGLQRSGTSSRNTINHTIGYPGFQRSTVPNAYTENPVATLRGNDSTFRAHQNLLSIEGDHPIQTGAHDPYRPTGTENTRQQNRFTAHEADERNLQTASNDINGIRARRGSSDNRWGERN
ncbi:MULTISPECIES: RHS repeat-associated core domain-containing protein [unclassified Pseudomonas]|uniref:RHS repeat-associated core domain-containing protein n=1 Tax=unclassified Pseudomonas TaxID=196821 RepID=UPI001CBC2BF8|nr:MULTISPECIES: RHS repeat-associated core domain-containing protein [unclassified Pseudomonas]